MSLWQTLLNLILALFGRRPIVAPETPLSPTLKLTSIAGANPVTVKLTATREVPKDQSVPSIVYTLDADTTEHVVAVTPVAGDATKLSGEVDASDAQSGSVWERNTGPFAVTDGAKVAFKAADFVPRPEMPSQPVLTFLTEVPDAPPGGPAAHTA